jgi:aminodeoxyfutalosine synthase
MSKAGLVEFIKYQGLDPVYRKIAEKVMNDERVSVEDGLCLYESNELAFLAVIADFIRDNKNGQYAFFNRNIHIEPTNICILKCKFCSYYRNEGEPDSWELSDARILEILKPYKPGEITEVHIVSGVHPRWTIEDYAHIIRIIRNLKPEVHIKAYTAVELDFMFRKAHLKTEEGFALLKEAGLNSIPGGGAEILHPEIRKLLCPEKISGDRWINIHRIAHQSGIPSNATMLYGHLEKYEHRIDHLNQLRKLQDETHGFNAFIPLKFRNSHNMFSYLKETSVNEDLKNYAVCRIFLDNIPHIKAYWPMIGKQTASISLAFGVDDLDGTIDDSTKIYSLAGAEDKHPSMNSEEMQSIITSAGRLPAERDSLYNIIHEL